MNLNRILLMLLAAVWAATVALGSTSVDNAARVGANAAGRDKAPEAQRIDAAAAPSSAAAQRAPKPAAPGAK